MHSALAATSKPCRLGSSLRSAGQALALVVLVGGLSGCAALSNPVANGLPVRRLPPQLMAEPREGKQTIPLNWLRQRPPEAYRLGPDDVLGVWIETVLGEPNQIPPVTQPPTVGSLVKLPPALGYPIAVRADGSLPLPLIKPLPVKGMTLDEAQEAARRAYIDQHILQPGKDKIIFSLARPRFYHIMVLRQDSGGLTIGSTGLIGGTKRGTGQALDLPAYENDVLNALALSGGLPGLDAYDEVVIERGGFDPLAPGCPPIGAGAGLPVTRIPLRMHPGEPMPFTPEDVVLHTGDVVFIEARETDLWYSGGLLPPAEHVLPRDHDLDVVQAVTVAGFPLVSGGLSNNNLTGAISSPGFGFPSPSRLTVVRRTAGGGQIPIQVDLNLALRDPRERLVLQPGDVLILQESPAEAFARYLSQKINITIVWQFIHGPHESGTATGMTP
jgi:protein involved in polysaccharide export with SLBB domain